VARPDEDLRSLLQEALDVAGEVAREWAYIEDWRGDGTVSVVYEAPGWEQLVGGTASSPVEFVDRIHPDDRPEVDALYRRDGNFDVEYRVAGDDGLQRWVRDRGVVRRAPDGSARVIGLLSDATDSVALRTTMESIAEAIDEYFFTDERAPDGTFEPIFATAAVHRLLGPIPEGLSLGAAWRGAIHPDDRSISAAAGVALRQGDPVDTEYRLVGYDGITRLVRVRAWPRETRADGTLIVEGVAVDITAARATEERIAQIAATIHEVLYIDELHPDGTTVEIYNAPTAARLIGRALDESVDAWRRHVHPDDRATLDAYDTSMASLVASEIEYRVIGADGVVRWIHDEAHPRRRSDGVIEVHGILRDVTAEREAAEAAARAVHEADLLSRVDPLTGSFNRRHLLEALRSEFDRAGTVGSRVGLLALEVDDFHAVVDLHGQGAGDELLRGVARKVGSTLPETSVFARWGGEEFVVVLPDLDGREALLAAAESVRRAVAEDAFTVAGEAVRVSASVGAAQADAGGTPETLLAAADRALAAARTAGRNVSMLAVDLARGGPTEPMAVRLARTFSLSAAAREGMPPNHLEDVAEYSARVALELGLSSLDALRCRIAGWLHDVGKISIPDAILLKPGSLARDEWDVMRSHVVIGEDLVRQVPELAGSAPAVRHHHERFDGSGYPDGLAGAAIPVEARIVAAVDAYSAMTSPRVYSRQRSPQQAITELRACAGTHFDPVVVEALLRVLYAARVCVRIA
jgi:diguanylate cyclase (GGDEF)-like protein